VVSATVFPKLFFPTLDPTTGLRASLATFGVIGAWNVISLAMILIGPETRGSDINRIDSPQMLTGRAPVGSFSG